MWYLLGLIYARLSFVRIQLKIQWVITRAIDVKLNHSSGAQGNPVKDQIKNSRSLIRFSFLVGLITSKQNPKLRNKASILTHSLNLSPPTHSLSST